jgi:hypothetical protein
MIAYSYALGLIAGTIVLCNLVVLVFRHPRLPAWLGSEFVVMMVGVLVTIGIVAAYAAATSLILSTLPRTYFLWVMIGVAVMFVALAFVLAAAMGMKQRLRRAADGGSPFARRPLAAAPPPVAASPA